MKNKGFTLIELLAVIVILAIIALIATPIILNIIEDAKEESNKRSVEMYANAVRNGMAAYQLTGGEVPAGTYNEENQLPFKVEVDGNVVCDRIDIYEDGGIYITDCTVNGDPVEHEYGTEQQVTKPTRYYAWDISVTVGTTDAPVEAERLIVPPTGKKVYPGYEVDANNKVSTAYICFKREENGIEYCLKGELQEEKKASTYEANKAVLLEAFGASTCYSDFLYTVCQAGGFDMRVDSTGDIFANDGSAGCSAMSSGTFVCREL